MPSPYANIPTSDWEEKTRELIDAHPLNTAEIVDVVLLSWTAIFTSKIGPSGFQIGRDILPKPQIMGFLLHELIPLEFKKRYPGQWDREKSASDKDLVFLPDPSFSVEIKSSSHNRQIFGNRSYAQAGSNPKKSKAGYYLTINFAKFTTSETVPHITLVRFGWLDHTDCIAQAAATGQQSRLSMESDQYKLKVLYRAQR